MIIGGGDTGADCLGTSTRHGAASITQLEIMPEPPESRPSGQPWPTYPMTFRVSSAHEEAGERVYAVSTKEFLGDDDGNVRALKLVDVVFEGGKLTEIEGTEREIPAQLVLFAMGFLGPEKPGLVEQLGVDLDERGNVARDKALHDLGDRRLLRRRRRSRPVAHRLGHRRGPRRGRRRRRVPHRLHDPALARSRPPRGRWSSDARESRDPSRPIASGRAV